MATMLGSLIVHARRSTGASASLARWQNAPKRSAVSSATQPPRSATQRGVVKWWKRHDRVDAGVEQRLPEGEVVVDGGRGPLPRLGLDAAPLDREPVVVETELAHDGHVLGPAVPRVAGVAARRRHRGTGRVLERPPVVVPVAALDLVGCGGSPPAEPLGEPGHGIDSSRSPSP